jgi:hypothetical protein
MKKTLSILCFLTAFFFIIPTAFGLTSAQDANTNQVSLTVTAAGLVDFTFDPSPNVSMIIVSAQTAYAVQCTNTATDTNTGKVFGALSTSTGYAQRDKTETPGAAVTAPASETALDGGDWTWVGGSGSASGS